MGFCPWVVSLCSDVYKSDPLTGSALGSDLCVASAAMTDVCWLGHSVVRPFFRSVFRDVHWFCLLGGMDSCIVWWFVRLLFMPEGGSGIVGLFGYVVLSMGRSIGCAWGVHEGGCLSVCSVLVLRPLFGRHVGRRGVVWCLCWSFTWVRSVGEAECGCGYAVRGIRGFGGCWTDSCMGGLVALFELVVSESTAIFGRRCSGCEIVVVADGRVVDRLGICQDSPSLESWLSMWRMLRREGASGAFGRDGWRGVRGGVGTPCGGVLARVW